MGNILRTFILFLGVAFTINVINLLIRKKITEKHSILWLLGSVFVLALSVAPMTLDRIAKLVGVVYPPTFLFLISILMLLFINLYHSVQISSLTSQVRELAQLMAVKEILEKKCCSAINNDVSEATGVRYMDAE